MVSPLGQRVKHLMKRSVFLALLLFFSACENNHALPDADQSSDALAGTWLLFEQGYSPGSGYFVNQIPAHPALLIQFGEDLSFSSNLPGYDSFKYYRVHKENSDDVLTLYDKNPDGNVSPAESRAYTMLLADNTLKLHFRWCIEGCHEAFRKVEEDDLQNP